MVPSTLVSGTLTADRCSNFNRVVLGKTEQWNNLLRRKSISGNWKTNIGSAMLEQIQMADRYRMWIDSVSELFDGLDMCALEVIVGRDGKEAIIEVNDCALSLMGDSQEEDRRLIADLVCQKMQTVCKPSPVLTKTASRASVSSTMDEDEVMKTEAGRRDSQASQSSTVSAASKQIFGRQGSVSGTTAPTSGSQEDTDDTMKNLRKTFAGIFGDM